MQVPVGSQLGISRCQTLQRAEVPVEGLPGDRTVSGELLQGRAVCEGLPQEGSTPYLGHEQGIHGLTDALPDPIRLPGVIHAGE